MAGLVRMYNWLASRQSTYHIRALLNHEARRLYYQYAINNSLHERGWVATSYNLSPQIRTSR